MGTLNEKLEHLNEALSYAILKEYHKYGGKLLLTMSGGMDTRLILAIMLKNNIKPHLLTWDGSPGDIKIATKISDFLHLNLIIIPKKTSDPDWLESVNRVLMDYDIIYYGELMSETFNKYVRFTESEKKLNDVISNFFIWVDKNVDERECNKIMPCLDRHVIEATEQIPICFRVYGYINRRLIKYNYPDLLNIPHTVVNLRYRLAESLYWSVVPILEYYLRGKNVRAK